MVEGIAGDYVPGLGGKFVVCSIAMDLIQSIQPEFDLNLSVWNQFEAHQSRHLHFEQFEQYDLIDDLQLGIGDIFTAKWHFASTSMALWAVFYQTLGTYAWGGYVWQHPSYTTQVVLPAVPTR
jgi:hypothetical protein